MIKRDDEYAHGIKDIALTAMSFMRLT